jgi:hypothetical protein
MVCRLTPSRFFSDLIRLAVAPQRSAAISTTTVAGYSLGPRKRSDGGVAPVTAPVHRATEAEPNTVLRVEWYNRSAGLAQIGRSVQLPPAIRASLGSRLSG